jgi:hypothetical protein
VSAWRWIPAASLVMTAACHDAFVIDDGSRPDSGGVPDAFAPPAFDAFAPTGYATDAADDVALPPGPYAYFFGSPANGGAVYGVAEGTTIPMQIAASDASHVVGSAVAQTASQAYYVSEDPGSTYSIHAAGIGGSPDRTLVSGLVSAEALAADAANVYFLVQSAADAGVVPEGTVWRVPVTGGPAESIAELSGSVRGIAVDSSYVYWTQTNVDGDAAGSEPGSVLRVPLSGGTPEILAADQASPGSIAVDEGNVFWLEGTTSGCTGAEGSLVALVAGASQPVILASSLASPSSLAARSGSAYVTLAGSTCSGAGALASGSVVRVGLDGGSTALVGGVVAPGNVFVDAVAAYFTVVTDPASGALGVNLAPP